MAHGYEICHNGVCHDTARNPKHELHSRLLLCSNPRLGTTYPPSQYQAMLLPGDRDIRREIRLLDSCQLAESPDVDVDQCGPLECRIPVPRTATGEFRGHGKRSEDHQRGTELDRFLCRDQKKGS